MMKRILLFLVLGVFCFTVHAFASGPVNVNTASSGELSQLIGIGKKISEKIVQYREANGPFKTVDDLIKVKGVGKKTIEKNIDLIIFQDPPKPASKK